MPPCTSANTFCVVCTREEEVEERGLLGFLGMRDPLDWDPDPQAASPEPSVSTSHKSTRLCRIVNREFKKKKKKKFPSFVFLPLGEDRFSTLVRSTQKSLPLSQPWSTITVSLPSERSLTAGQKASQNSQRVLVQTTGRFTMPAYTNSL